MGNMLIRNIPEDVHDAIRERAKRNNRSAEAEVCALIVEAVRSSEQGGFGTRLHRAFESVPGDDLPVQRDKSPVDPPDLT